MPAVVDALDALAATIAGFGVDGLPAARIEFDPEAAAEDLAKQGEGPAVLWLTPLGARHDHTRGPSVASVEVDVMLARLVSHDRAEVPGLVGMLETLAERLAGRVAPNGGWAILPESAHIAALTVPDMLYVHSVYIGAVTVTLTRTRAYDHAAL